MVLNVSARSLGSSSCAAVAGQGSAFRLASPGEPALVVLNTEGKPHGVAEGPWRCVVPFMHDPVGCAGGKTCVVVSCALPR